jgi:hypothetical protein
LTLERFIRDKAIGKASESNSENVRGKSGPCCVETEEVGWLTEEDAFPTIDSYDRSEEVTRDEDSLEICSDCNDKELTDKDREKGRDGLRKCGEFVDREEGHALSICGYFVQDRLWGGVPQKSA